jgi:hypothetical protein
MTTDDTPLEGDEGADSEDSGTDTPARDPETGQFLPKDERPDGDSETPDTDVKGEADSGGSTDQPTHGRADDPPTAKAADEPMTDGTANEPETGESEDESRGEVDESQFETTEEKPTDESTSGDEPRPDGESSAESGPGGDEPTNESGSGVNEPAVGGDEPAQQPGESSIQSSTGDPVPEAGGDREPPATTPPAEGSPTGGTGTHTATGLSPGTVFVTNPDGYPRPSTVFLPTLPWLRLPSRPLAHETVSL